MNKFPATMMTIIYNLNPNNVGVVATRGETIRERKID